MIVIGLDGKQYKWLPKNSQKNNCSSYHLKAKELLKNLFTTDIILEEVVLPGSDLTVDFYLPLRKLGVEVQGEQHTNFTKFFHKDRLGFGKSINRDNNKAKWFQDNGFNFIALDYTENLDEWRSKIKSSLT